MRGGVQARRDPGSDRVEVDIGHGRQYRALVAQCLAFVAAFPEATLAVVLAIRAAGDGLDQTAHQPGRTAQPLPDECESDGIGL